jgi:hypothetical protein
VHEDRHPPLDVEGPADEVLDGHPPQQGGGRDAVRNPLGQAHQAVGGNDAPLGVRPRRARGVGHALARRELGDALAGFFDDAGRLHADAVRQARQGIEARPMVGVDEVDPDGRLEEQDLARARLARIERLEAQHLGTARLVDADGAAHAASRIAEPAVGQAACGRFELGARRSSDRSLRLSMTTWSAKESFLTSVHRSAVSPWIDPSTPPSP